MLIRGTWHSDSATPLQCKWVKLPSASIVRVRGEVDLANVHLLQESLDHAGHYGAPTIIDLTNVAYMDSTGMNVLMQFQEKSDRVQKGRVAVVFSSTLLLRVFSALSLQERIQVFPDVETAVSALVDQTP